VQQAQQVQQVQKRNTDDDDLRRHASRLSFADPGKGLDLGGGFIWSPIKAAREQASHSPDYYNEAPQPERQRQHQHHTPDPRRVRSLPLCRRLLNPLTPSPQALVLNDETLYEERHAPAESSRGQQGGGSEMAELKQLLLEEREKNVRLEG
jgi:hypothetical protein